MGMYSDYTAKNQCYCCSGKGERSQLDHDDRPYSSTCRVCAGTGLPSEAQKYKAKLEDQGLCIDCEFPVKDHPDQGFPYGCLRLLAKTVKKLVEGQQPPEEAPKTRFDLMG